MGLITVKGNRQVCSSARDEGIRVGVAVQLRLCLTLAVERGLSGQFHTPGDKTSGAY
jgi:hypothetical protein